jgi:putative aminopeptidase FrvX
MAVPELLAELLLAPGGSGYEEPVQAIVRREAEAIGAEIGTDVLGTTIATVKGTSGDRTLALFGTPTRSRCRSGTRAATAC